MIAGNRPGSVWPAFCGLTNPVKDMEGKPPEKSVSIAWQQANAGRGSSALRLLSPPFVFLPPVSSAAPTFDSLLKGGWPWPRLFRRV